MLQTSDLIYMRRLLRGHKEDKIFKKSGFTSVRHLERSCVNAFSKLSAAIAGSMSSGVLEPGNGADD